MAYYVILMANGSRACNFFKSTMNDLWQGRSMCEDMEDVQNKYSWL